MVALTAKDSAWRIICLLTSNSLPGAVVEGPTSADSSANCAAALNIAGLGDGVGVALFNQPRGLFLYGPDPLHLMTVYVADTGNAIIRRFPLESLFVSTPALTAGPPPAVAAPVRALRPVASKYPLP
jgi:hypothetical protein